MPELYRRKIVVDVAGLTITDPRIAVEVQRNIDPTQDGGTCRIFNLSPDHADQIEQRGERVRIEAGYPQTLAIIFDGEAQRIRQMRDGLAHVVEIGLGDLVRDRRVLAGSYNRSWAGPATVREIAVDIISTGLGLLAGPLQAIPEDATFENFYWGGGPATGALEALLRPFALTWFEDDGAIRVNRVGHCQPDAPAILATPQAGLVGVPTRTDEGAEAVMFCEPRARLGGELRIDGLKDRSLTGRWKIVGLSHRLDNWEGEFSTRCDLRALG